MERKVMVLSDSLIIRDEAVQYSLGLAGRLDAFVVLLFLLEFNEFESLDQKTRSLEDLEKRALQSNRAILQEYRDSEILVELWVKVGDPASEFLKFMAGTGSYQAIIWGGSNSVYCGKSHGMKGHWLFKIRDLVDCPLVAPSMKRGSGTQFIR